MGAAIPVAGAYDDVFLVVFIEGDRRWQSGTVHSTREEAQAFAVGMKGYVDDADVGGGRFTYDSFEVVRYSLAKESA